MNLGNKNIKNIGTYIIISINYKYSQIKQKPTSKNV